MRVPSAAHLDGDGMMEEDEREVLDGGREEKMTEDESLKSEEMMEEVKTKKVRGKNG